MKNLILVRHAKSSWEYDVRDFDRPLKSRGKNDAITVAERFKTSGLLPDLIMTSGANRAKTTAELFNKTLKIPNDRFVVTNELYDFSGGAVMHAITSCDNAVTTLMVFGHNHALTYLANSLGDRGIDNVPTSGLVSIAFNVDNWQDINTNTGKTMLTLFPKDIRTP
ncbi:phosphohistidine phosphatase [Mangrovimonas yunxiaonensis]|uniref:Phosphohistidine phosphatase n=1 Tax=Mangrovimonas yunxiaonensis TaxID=1197477 RepID=A0A084THT7_9FLAO|nr:histidine phosphatase family protein [Mangrovimonas yunxiaonensis]KFB00273.1 phosphohistidine phosphatase [Mangrovimonas yunxiaonensis]GGH43000.1 phosphohistidine phosphatase SixA [Mangrovimonas yunxiaonensis]